MVDSGVQLHEEFRQCDAVIRGPYAYPQENDSIGVYDVAANFRRVSLQSCRVTSIGREFLEFFFAPPQICLRYQPAEHVEGKFVRNRREASGNILRLGKMQFVGGCPTDVLEDNAIGMRSFLGWCIVVSLMFLREKSLRVRITTEPFATRKRSCL